jgi:D-glycero-D-manno-heptose 1,7-bisphosphate phosphatase
VFFDRDGTLLVEVGYLNHASLVVPYRFTVEALRIARESGFLLIVVTNQSGIARGYITEEDLGEIHRKMRDTFEAAGVTLDAVYYCPHHAQGKVAAYRQRCGCRKPAPGMGLEAAGRFGIDLAGSYMVGDKETDVVFGRNLGVTPCLVRTGYGRCEETSLTATSPDDLHVFDNVLAAAEWIAGRE